MSMTEPNAQVFWDYVARCGATVIGRTLFDLTDVWGGGSPGGEPVVVLSHRAAPTSGSELSDARFHFVTEGGIEPAVARATGLAGNRKRHGQRRKVTHRHTLGFETRSWGSSGGSWVEPPEP